MESEDGVLFVSWLLTLSVMFLRFIYGKAFTSISFLPIAE